MYVQYSTVLYYTGFTALPPLAPKTCSLLNTKVEPIEYLTNERGPGNLPKKAGEGLKMA